MRLGRNKDSDKRPLPDEVQTDLDAVDAALRGEEAPPGLEDLGLLASDLKEMRPEASGRFEGEMDEWAAAGFPRGGRPGVSVPTPGPSAQSFFARFTPVGTRGWAPIAATATAVVVVSVSVAQLGDFGESNTAGDSAAPSGAISQDSADGEAAPTMPSETGGAEILPGDLDDVERGEGALELPPGPSVPTYDNASTLGLTTPDSEIQDALDEALLIIENNGGIVTSSRVTMDDGESTGVLEAQVEVDGYAETVDEVEALGSVTGREDKSSSRFRPGEPQDVSGSPLLAPFVLTIAPEPAGPEASASADDPTDALETGVGILVISLAILVPLGLLTVLAYVGFDRLSRRARERTLDGPG